MKPLPPAPASATASAPAPSGVHARSRPRACTASVAFALGAFSALAVAGASAGAGGYSDAPIREPVFDPASLTYRASFASGWLGVAWPLITPAKYPALRSEVHALIDARVKELYARDGSIVPRQSDEVLSLLFAWAARLGVYSADVAFRMASHAEGETKLPGGPTLPPGVSLVREGEAIRVTDEVQRLSFAVPYYFFVVRLGGGNAANDPVVDVAMGTTADRSAAGFTQPSITVYRVQESQTRDPRGLLASLGPASEGATVMLREVRFVRGGDTTLAVVYTGTEGPYQRNQAHFLDFVAKLQVR